ncbi:hypothetical protein L7F22_031472 [Adiantum nelumboides]|nr:hypothetical protein [Adiantum nelumboides]
MDFIFGLPKTSSENEGIWTIVDRFSKQAHFIPVRKQIAMEQMSKTFLVTAFKYHGIPRSIVSDRDPRMTRLFWRALWQNLHSTLRFSSSYHPQTDGQSEIVTSTEHQQLLSAIELEALKEKVEGKRPGFGKVTCVVATMPSKYLDIEKNLALSKLTGILDGLAEDQMVVGSLDLNRTPKLPDEMCGSHPKGVEGQYRRGYLSNVCVTKAVQRNGVGTKLIKHAQMLALKEGISNLYTHVAVDNESAKRLYVKSGFVLEREERASDARLMGRPARLLLWMDLSKV